MKTIKILISGVGGQGTLLSSRVLGAYAQKCGYDCKLSEVHGMAQRGGSVVTHVKMAEKVFSPIVEQGDADVLMAFEKSESGRYCHFIKKDGFIIASSQELMPMSVVAGGETYPKNMFETLEQKGIKVITADAAELAKKAGNIKAANIVLIGTLVKALNLDKKIMEEAIKSSVPAKTLDVNLKAFEYGYAAAN